ncbi:hypothetical protein N9998_00375 [Nitrosopumilus sp.]|nr:hypothetical protein [Nitrosopumilus sp.]
MSKNKCVVCVGDKEDDKVCGRDARHEYETVVKLEDGKLVNQNLFVCDRHTEVFEEFLNDQGNYQ